VSNSREVLVTSPSLASTNTQIFPTDMWFLSPCVPTPSPARTP
jgi:hypothetical protein